MRCKGQFGGRGWHAPEGLFAMRGGDWEGFGPFNFEFGGGRGWGHGRRRRRRMFGSGELRLVLLKLIADEPRHGYDLIRAIEELTGGDYVPSPGVIYPTLSMLEEMGLIEQTDGDGARKPFQITEAGRAYLNERAEEADELIGRLKGLAPDAKRGAGPSIGRAVGNLMTALRHRVGRDGLDDELLHEIAAILDEAAQRIERVK